MNPLDLIPDMKSRGSFISEFYVEFLGSLVPGLFALLLSVIVLLSSGFAACVSLCPDVAPLYLHVELKDIGIAAYAALPLLLVVAYVLGSLFYRQDTKMPDWTSARRIYRRADTKERKRLAVQPSTSEHWRIVPDDAQFPYLFLHEYLVGRGLDRLAKWVPWEGTKEETRKYRTKMFINRIKIRLQFLVPEKCRDIVRNEAHVRLATSLWYASTAIKSVCLLSILVLVVAIYLGGRHTIPSGQGIVLACDGAVFFLASVVKHKIGDFIHYLRVREVVYVLETADFAQRNGCDIHPEDFRDDTSKDPEESREAQANNTPKGIRQPADGLAKPSA